MSCAYKIMLLQDGTGLLNCVDHFSLSKQLVQLCYYLHSLYVLCSVHTYNGYIDIGFIFTELLMGKPLFPGRNVVLELDIMTDFLGFSSTLVLLQIRNEKARRYLSSVRKKKPIPFSHRFPNADPLALHLLGRMLAFEPKDQPSAEE
ncbi:hypothetical protein RJ639_042843 [Escallonia herrerae]|uniref:Protein kinase domain-containing protein n=1 Tax=Escallonia herrerae TaxID=1293975 RepID=A0AA88WCH4_9ASTE|nr:hypothetical protein RJ639_042843 [Escallonia herrerae]